MPATSVSCATFVVPVKTPLIESHGCSASFASVADQSLSDVDWFRSPVATLPSATVVLIELVSL